MNLQVRRVHRQFEEHAHLRRLLVHTLILLTITMTPVLIDAELTCSASNGACCLSTLRKGSVTAAELRPFHEQEEGETGLITTNLTTAVDYELFFRLTMVTCI